MKYGFLCPTSRRDWKLTNLFSKSYWKVLDNEGQTFKCKTSRGHAELRNITYCGVIEPTLGRVCAR